MNDKTIIIEIKDNCLICPFFYFQLHINTASGCCRCPDLTRAIKLDIKSYQNKELKINGKYGDSNIIKVPRPKWCPLTIGEVIIMIEK